VCATGYRLGKFGTVQAQVHALIRSKYSGRC
jgi:hypothetical protein